MLKILLKNFKKKVHSPLGKDIGLTFFTQIAIMLLAFAINKILSVKLGVDGYGQYSIIKKSTAVLSFTMLGGMGIALPRYLAMDISGNHRKQAKSTVVSSLLIVVSLGLLITFLCSLFQPVLGELITGTAKGRLYYSSLLYAVSLAFGSLLYAYYRGAGAFVKFSISQVSIQVMVAIVALIFGTNLVLMIDIWTISNFVFVLSSAIIDSKKNIIYKESVSWSVDIKKQLQTIAGYGLPRLAGDFFLFSFAAFPLIFISQKLSIKSSSFFAVGITLVSMVLPLFSFLGMVLLPYVSSSIAQNNFKQADKLINQLLVLYVALALSATFVLWLGGEWFIRLFFSPDFVQALPVARLLVVSILFESVYLLLRNPIDASSKIPYNTYTMVISFMVLVILFFVSSTLKQFSAAYLAAIFLRAAISFVVWRIRRKNLLKTND